MYADRVVPGSKRSLRDRLNGNFAEENTRSRQTNLKRQRETDDKWEHDLYEDNEEPQISNPKLGYKDLRLKLQRKGPQQTSSSGKVFPHGVRDLRDKLAGTMHSQPANTDLSKVKQVTEVKPDRKGVYSVEALPPEVKKVVNPTSSKKKLQQKVDVPVVVNPASSRKKTHQKTENTVEGLLQSLSLEKYLITFQAEEIDMTALVHMTDEDLKAIGIPMGPRKKILLALGSRD